LVSFKVITNIVGQNRANMSYVHHDRTYGLNHDFEICIQDASFIQPLKAHPYLLWRQHIYFCHLGQLVPLGQQLEQWG